MKEVKFYCDKCKAETEEKNLRSLRFAIAKDPGEKYSYVESRKEVCALCLSSMGISIPDPERNRDVDVAQETFEQNFFDLLGKYGLSRD